MTPPPPSCLYFRLPCCLYLRVCLSPSALASPSLFLLAPSVPLELRAPGPGLRGFQVLGCFFGQSLSRLARAAARPAPSRRVEGALLETNKNRSNKMSQKVTKNPTKTWKFNLVRMVNSTQILMNAKIHDEWKNSIFCFLLETIPHKNTLNQQIHVIIF